MRAPAAICSTCDWSWYAEHSDDLANAIAEIAAEEHAAATGHTLLLFEVIRPGPATLDVTG
jgi:hypothetical protein